MNRFTTRAGIAGAGLLAAGGLVTMMVAGASGAAAAGPVTASGSTLVSATVPLATTFTDNTPTLDFGTVALGVVNGPMPVSLTLSTNDSAGYSTSVAPLGGGGPNGLWSGTGSTPTSFIPWSDLSVTGNGAAQNGGATGDYSGIDTSNAAFTGNLTDNWSLNVPGTQGPATYSGTIQYTVTPS